MFRIVSFFSLFETFSRRIGRMTNNDEKKFPSYIARVFQNSLNQVILMKIACYLERRLREMLHAL